MDPGIPEYRQSVHNCGTLRTGVARFNIVHVKTSLTS
jgi:hypothetical protein